MGTEYEELRITVKLIGDTSADMAKLRQHFSEVIVNARGIEEARRASLEDTRAIRQLTQSIAGLSTAMKAVSLLGAYFSIRELRRQWAGLREWSTEIVQSTNQMRQIGASYDEFRNIADQFRRVGISAQETKQILAGVSRSVAELSRPGSSIRDALMQGAGPGTQRMMGAYLETIARSRSIQEATVRWQIASENVYRNELRRTNSELLARNLQYKFLVDAQQDPALMNATRQLTEPTRQQAEFWARMEKNAAGFDSSMDRLNIALRTVVDIIRTDAIDPNGPLVRGLNAAAWAVEKLADGYLKYEQAQKLAHERGFSYPMPSPTTAFPPLGIVKGLLNLLPAGKAPGEQDKVQKQNDKVQTNTRLLRDVNKKLEDQISGAKQGPTPQMQEGGVVGKQRVTVGEAGPEAIVNLRTGQSSIVDRPTTQTLENAAVLPLTSAGADIDKTIAGFATQERYISGRDYAASLVENLAGMRMHNAADKAKLRQYMITGGEGMS